MAGFGGSAGEFLTPDSARDVFHNLLWEAWLGLKLMKNNCFSLCFAPTLDRPKENEGFEPCGPPAATLGAPGAGMLMKHDCYEDGGHGAWLSAASTIPIPRHNFRGIQLAAMLGKWIMKLPSPTLGCAGA